MFAAIFTIILLCGCSSEKRPAGEIVSESYGKGYDNWQEAYATYIEENATFANTLKKVNSIDVQHIRKGFHWMKFRMMNQKNVQME